MTSEQEQSLVIENIAALPQFYELVDLASDVCLHNPERVKQIIEHDRELITGDTQLPHVWSARGIFEPKYSARRNYSNDSRGYHLSTDEAITSPSRFGPRPIPEVQLMVKSFGEALLEEAFVCLGKDAHEMVEAWQKDSSAGNRTKVANWLLDRIESIVSQNEEPSAEDDITIEDLPPADTVIQLVDVEQSQHSDINPEEIVTINVPTDEASDAIGDEEHFYHPARLSPKLLGTHPNTTFRPTCLGISILAAAFYKKAGEPLLHAGVMRTTTMETKRSLVNCSQYFTDFAKSRQIEIPDSIAQNIKKDNSTYQEERDNDRGFHAAVLARFDEKRWIITDPNYRSNRLIWADRAERNPSTLFNDLELISGGLGGVDIPYEREEGRIGLLFEVVADEIINRMPSQDYVTGMVDALITHPDPVSVLKQYMRNCLGLDSNNRGSLRDAVSYHVGRLNFDADNEEFQGFSAEDVDAFMELVTDERIDQYINIVLGSYLFPDSTLENVTKSIDRLKSDSRYKQNRIDDLQLIPLLVVIIMLSEITNEVNEGKAIYPHAYTEVGLAEHRIGMCVLNDFASYCGDELPASFWTSHWSSGIAWAEHENGKYERKGQHGAAYQIARLLETRWLTYGHNGEIIRQFLEQGAQPKGVG